MEKTKTLFDKALTNFDCAKIIRASIKLEDEEMLNLVGYHLQQALELSLKYTLEMNGVEYPNTHRIEDLLRIGKNNNVELYLNDYIIEHDTLFTSWEANSRYIIGFLIEIDKIDKAIPEIEEYLKNLIDVYKNWK